ncbi:MAG: hypothetical protein LUD01_03070 [Clostridiales bacterium]|nr:hypothetical protein [Clostridiales bacterium]
MPISFLCRNTPNIFQSLTVGTVLYGRSETIETVPAKYQDLTFSKLFGYYGSKGIVLKEETFIKNLGLRNAEGEYNLLAQLLSDDSHIPLRVSIFSGKTKGSKLFSVREFGNISSVAYQ